MLATILKCSKLVATRKTLVPLLLSRNFCNSSKCLSDGKMSHSKVLTHKYLGFTVKVLPALSDNYMYLLIDDTTKTAAIVDPVHPDSILEAAKKEDVTVNSILTTHHHWDHASGNDGVVKLLGKNIRVYGGDSRIPSLNVQIESQLEFSLGRLNIRGIRTPAHTTNHICYYVTAHENDGSDGVVFTGDTLFLSGCGRFFEGTAQDMFESLNKKLSSLPNNTKVYCGHEYTVANLKFALSVEPENEDIKAALQHAIELRNDKIPTVPSTLGDEKRTNPFMRVHLAKVQNYTDQKDLVSTMQILRDRKNSFQAS